MLKVVPIPKEAPHYDWVSVNASVNIRIFMVTPYINNIKYFIVQLMHSAI